MIGLLIAVTVGLQHIPAALEGMDNCNAEGMYSWFPGQYDTWGPNPVIGNCASEKAVDRYTTILSCQAGPPPVYKYCITLVREKMPKRTRYFARNCDGGVMGIETSTTLLVMGTEITEQEFLPMFAQNVMGTATPCHERSH